MLINASICHNSISVSQLMVFGANRTRSVISPPNQHDEIKSNEDMISMGGWAGPSLYSPTGQ